MTIYHNSHQAIYRIPFGAVSTGTTVHISLDVSVQDVRTVYFCWKVGDQQEQRIGMRIAYDEADFSRFSLDFRVPDQPNLVWYYFVVEHKAGTTYYGNNDNGYGGEGQESVTHPPTYQITVYGNKHLPPEWFKGKVMYQIFVDRFCNGNENKTIDNSKKGSLLHSHWDNDPVYVRGEKGEILNWDFFGGNLLGVKQKLPYLSDLGVDIIYLNPIFHSPSNHKYDTADFHQIDEMFGDEEIFQQLCTEAANLGMSIILDGVFSHSGSDSKYFNKEGTYPTLGAYQSVNSPYFTWYQFKKHPDEYEAWWGIDTMPNINELDPSFLDFLIHSEDSVINHWQRFGVIGWRLDVADELPDAFIRLLKEELRKRNSDTILIGEVWEDASNKISYDQRRSYLLGEELDSVTNYIFRDTVISFMLGNMVAEEVDRKLTSLYENYPKPHFYRLMNIVGTHDTSRIRSEMEKDISEGEAIDLISVKRTKLVSLWQVLFPGVPCIYYGDEAGLRGAVEPLNRRTYPWGNENKELLDWYHRILAIKKKYDVFQQGEWFSLWIDDDVYGFILKTEAACAVVLINRSMEDKQVKLNDFTGTFVNLLDNKRVDVTDFLLPSLGGVVLLKHSVE